MPPPKPAGSIWAWVGWGCLGLVLLAVGGCITTFAYFGHKFAVVDHTPYDPVAGQAALGDTPVFPGAVQDIPESKRMRITTLEEKTLFQADKADAVAYLIDTEYERIMGWFCDEMQKRGFKIAGIDHSGNAFFTYSKTVIILQPLLNRTTRDLLGYSVTRLQGARRFDINQFTE